MMIPNVGKTTYHLSVVQRGMPASVFQASLSVRFGQRKANLKSHT